MKLEALKTLTSIRTACGMAAAAGIVLGGCASHEVRAPSARARGLSLSSNGHPVASGTNRQSGPYQVGLTGGDSVGPGTASDESGHPWDAPYGFYGEIMAAGTQPGINDESWTGLENLSQSSFALEGSDFDPCVTPDGERIVFASTQHTATANLYIKGVESRAVTQLTNDPADNVMPKVSPDGTRIAFASNRAGNWDLYVMPVTGGRALQVTSEPSAELHPTWSPDGTSLAFCRLGAVSGRWEVWVTGVQNTGISQFLTYGLFPEWCPVAGAAGGGADRILFQRSRERGDRSFGVWTIDYKNGQASGATEVVASAVAACINPSWSPDGEWITFSTVPSAAEWAASGDGRPTSANLWLVSSHGGGLVSLTSGGAVNLMPTWGPGNRLFFISDRGGVENIWHMNAADAIIAATGRVDDGTAIGRAGAPGHGNGAEHQASHEDAQAGVDEDAHH
jgi:Tol biopolymer transport system component